MGVRGSGLGCRCVEPHEGAHVCMALTSKPSWTGDAGVVAGDVAHVALVTQLARVAGIAATHTLLQALATQGALDAVHVTRQRVRGVLNTGQKNRDAQEWQASPRVSLPAYWGAPSQLTHTEDTDW